MVEIQIPRSTYTHLELIALMEGLTPAQLLGVMVKEYTGTDTLKNLADFASPQNRADRTVALSARRAATATIKGETQ